MLCEKHKDGSDFSHVSCYQCDQELNKAWEKLAREIWITIHTLPWWKRILVLWLWPALLSMVEFLRKYHTN